MMSLISGCGFFSRLTLSDEPDLTRCDDTMVCRVPLDVTYPTPMTWQSTNFYVLTPERMQSILDGNKEGLPEVYFALTPRGYENMAINVSEMLRIMETYKATLQALESYYVPRAQRKTDSDEEDSE